MTFENRALLDKCDKIRKTLQIPAKIDEYPLWRHKKAPSRWIS
jgi:hypothetical protein